MICTSSWEYMAVCGGRLNGNRVIDVSVRMEFMAGYDLSMATRCRL